MSDYQEYNEGPNWRSPSGRGAGEATPGVRRPPEEHAHHAKGARSSSGENTLSGERGPLSRLMNVCQAKTAIPPQFRSPCPSP